MLCVKVGWDIGPVVLERNENVKTRGPWATSLTWENSNSNQLTHMIFIMQCFILKMVTMGPAMSPNFFSGRNIKQAGKCSKGSLFREWINSESDNRQRILGSFARSKKKGWLTLYSFSINQALKLGRSQTCHISDLSVSKRTWIYAREKKHTTKYDDAIELCWLHNSNHWSFCWSREHSHLPSFLCLSIVTFNVPFNNYLHFVINVRFAATINYINLVWE